MPEVFVSIAKHTWIKDSSENIQNMNSMNLQVMLLLPDIYKH